MFVVGLWELIVLIAAVMPRENIETVFSPVHDLHGSSEQEFHLFAAFWELVFEVHAGKRHIFGLFQAANPNGVMDRGLGREAERIHPTMPEQFLVLRNQGGIGCEYVIEELRCINEVLEV